MFEIAIQYFAMLDFWERFREPEHWENLWMRVAKLCRYGHIGYEDALRMPLAEANALGWALNRLFEEEQKSLPSHED